MDALVYGLVREPFSVAPDPRFLYFSAQHRQALDTLLYGLQRSGGFVLLTGEIGAGKTTVWRAFLEALPAQTDVAYVGNPKLGVTPLLRRICEELQVPLAEDSTDLIDALHGHLLLAHGAGRRTLIAVDEAQALSFDVLETLRLLTNLETSEHKLVQVLLIGQPELRDMLAMPELESVAQRIVARFHLERLSRSGTRRYIAHRLAVAGHNGPPLFDADADRLVHRLCRGVPRRINVLCDRALRLAHEAGLSAVNNPSVRRAADDVFGRSADRLSFWPDQQAKAWLPWLSGGALVAALLVASNAWYRSDDTASASTEAGPGLASAAPPAAVPSAAAASTAPGLLQLASGTGLADDLSAKLFAKPATSEAEAMRRLARFWGAELGPGEPCAAAAAQGLACFSNPRGLSVVRQLDRPGLMTLSDEQGRIARVLVMGMDDSAVRVLLHGQTLSVPLSQMTWWWRGDFSTFWRTPPGQGGGTLENNPALSAWLAQHLDALDGEPAEAADAATLRTRVAAFQQRHRLRADGEAGPLTLMLLNRVSGVIEPSLERGAVSAAPIPTPAPAPSGPAQPGARPG